jgi:hypothetical protein
VSEAGRHERDLAAASSNDSEAIPPAAGHLPVSAADDQPIRVVAEVTGTRSS